MIYHRVTKGYEKDRQFGGLFLKLLYSGFMKPVRGPFLTKDFSENSAWLMDKFYTQNRIDRAMRQHKIEGSRFQYYPFKNFRDFFLRKYKQESLPKVGPQDIISPSDGKVTVYSITEQLKVKVKDCEYTVRELFGGSDCSKFFGGGTLFIIRLSIHDCHRFIYTEKGVFSGPPVRKIPGLLHTVSSFSDGEMVLQENERRYSILETRHGLVGMMEVGAMMVGRIYYHHVQQAVPYEERGWFEPGGSTILVFYQNGIAQPDIDIVRESSKGNEVKVSMGERIGRYVC